MNIARRFVLVWALCLIWPILAAAGEGVRGPASQAAAEERIPVAVWRGGCCVPTLRLRDALESAFGQSPAFVFPPPESGPENLIVYISDSVRLEGEGEKARAVYRIEFRTGSTTGRLLRATKGSCRYDTLSVCVIRIVEDAKKAARKLH